MTPSQSDESGLTVADGPLDGSFEAAYAEHYDRLMRMALLLVGSVEVAEDVVQDAFASALRNWGVVRDQRAYLSTAVANAARNIYRARAAEARLPRQSPTTHVDSNRDLHESLLRLPYRQRAAIVLRYYVGLDDPAIARALGCTRSTVRSSVRRGLHQLRKEVR